MVAFLTQKTFDMNHQSGTFEGKKDIHIYILNSRDAFSLVIKM